MLTLKYILLILLWLFVSLSVTNGQAFRSISEIDGECGQHRGSGGEALITNNIDADKVDCFQQ